MAARIDEIAPDVYRVSIYLPQIDLQFNHFLIQGDEPLLFHTGMRRMFPEVRDAVAKLIDPAALRWISWSHFEVDECGALNEWLAVAPRAQAICSQVGALVNIEDFADRPPRGLAKDDVIETVGHTYRFVPTPHLPHGWDAGVLFEEKSGVLLCSDLFRQIGDVEPVTSADVLGRWDAAVTDAILNRLAREGVRVQTYALSPGAIVPCAVWDDDQLMVLRLRGDFGGATEFTLSQRVAGTEVSRVAGQVAASSHDEIIYAAPAAWIRQLPVAEIVLLTANEGVEERPIGRYTLVHGGISAHRQRNAALAFANDQPSNVSVIPLARILERGVHV